MPITYYNVSSFVDSTFKLVGSGYSALMPALAFGLSQKDLINIKDLENDVLKMGEKLKPLQTAYTQSGSDTEESGRPKKKEEEKAEQTHKNEESLDRTGGGS